MADQLYVATRKGLFTLEPRASASRPDWRITQTAFLGDPVSMVMRDPRDGCLYAALNHGHFGVKLHRSSDGINWEEWDTPQFPERSEDAKPDVCPMRGIPIPWNVEQIWSLSPGGDDQPGWLWCGTIPGGLFVRRSADQPWELVRSLWDHPSRAKWFGGGYDYPGIHSICVDPRDSNRVTLGVSCGGVWVTEDGGDSWNCAATGMFAEYMPPETRDDPEIQDPHIVVQCPNKPDYLWSQHHNGVFRSTDGSRSWQHVANVPPSSFGFAAGVHPHAPDVAWLVPAVKDEKRYPVEGQVVVARTRDGGQSFDVLREGLPQDHAYDIVYRHALDVDVTGDRLAIGSTTGSLWISENQGDAWNCAAANLPPVYCVRFRKDV